MDRLTLLTRRVLPDVSGPNIAQHVVDVPDPRTYRPLVGGHNAAVCTLGVGQPSEVSREEFLRVDRDAVVAFARACRDSGVEHFELLSSVGVDAESRLFYLRAKGELCEALVALRFKRLSLFHPSMILTPTNRYGAMQGLMLMLWPHLDPLLRGDWLKYRGVDVAALGEAMAQNLFTQSSGLESRESLYWPEIMALAGRTMSRG